MPGIRRIRPIEELRREFGETWTTVGAAAKEEPEHMGLLITFVRHLRGMRQSDLVYRCGDGMTTAGGFELGRFPRLLPSKLGGRLEVVFRVLELEDVRFILRWMEKDITESTIAQEFCAREQDDEARLHILANVLALHRVPNQRQVVENVLDYLKIDRHWLTLVRQALESRPQGEQEKVFYDLLRIVLTDCDRFGDSGTNGPIFSAAR